MARSARSNPSSSSEGALRVLLVEDTQDDADLLLRELRVQGYDASSKRVDTEDDLREAIRTDAWDIMICDWVMPRITAHRAIEIAHEEDFDGPIIIASGTMGEEHIVEALHAGAQEYIVKDNLRRLAPAIRRELQEAEVRRAARRAEESLAASEARYRTLVQTIPAATYIDIESDDASGYRTVFISPQITRMIGYTPEELTSDPDLWASLIHPDDRERTLADDLHHFETGEPLTHEFRMITRHSGIVWLLDEATIVQEGPGARHASQGILTDVTDRKRAEEDLRGQALIVENVHDAVIVVDVDNRILHLNPAAEELFGYPKEEVIGTSAAIMAAWGGQPGLDEEIATAIREAGRWSGEVINTRKDGTERVIELVVVPLRDEDGEMLGTVGVSRDITERKRAEDELRSSYELLRRVDEDRRRLLSSLVSAQEEERQRVAGDIHDDPIQKLTAAGLRLEMLKGKNPPADQLAEMGTIQALVEEAIARLRQMLFDLSPRILETGGLAVALVDYVDHANLEGGTRFRLEDRLALDLPHDIRTVAYRVILEALSNVRKHAAATNATVVIENDRQGGMRCRIVDDGSGFDARMITGSPPGHMGLSSMRERIELAGGTFAIHTAPGTGTTVEFTLPA
jgi:PAS domain S-box-containing protein